MPEVREELMRQDVAQDDVEEGGGDWIKRAGEGG